MTLVPGTRLAAYEIASLIGEGGMGQVYRAADQRLGRDVAIKVLPEALARDPERLLRFEREARLLASLNHPNIATLYGFEQAGDERFLVMELVRGETLAERLGRGPFPAREAFDVCRQIAEALEAAHEKGVLHRDLKPANVKITPERRVKLLDFGLAKAFWGGEEDAVSPTASVSATAAGVILGTAPYMSPEQARGQRLDKRSDVWSFGCVLYEALTGARAFAGQTVADTIGQILNAEPDWSAIPASAPEKACELVRRCLQKASSQRLHDIGDARLELEEMLATPAAARAQLEPAPRRRRGIWLAGASVLLGAGVLLWVLNARSGPPTDRVLRFEVPLPPGETIVTGDSLRQTSNVTLSPDGRRLVYAAGRGQGTRLYLRHLGEIEARPLPGTEGAFNPFFSPDGHWVGFFTETTLRKVPVDVDGGMPVTIEKMPPVSRGASWAPSGKIVFTPTFNEGLMAVPEGGGKWERVTALDVGEDEANHLWPEVLPGGNAVLFTVWKGGTFDDASIAVLSFGGGKHRVLIEGGSHARYLSTGHILFARAGALLAAPFDLRRLEVTGPALPVLEGIETSATTGAAQFAVSETGTLAYAPAGPGTERGLVYVDRRGAALPLTAARRDYNSPQLSPDGRSLAVSIGNDIWVHDLSRGTERRLTFRGVNQFPVWTPDGEKIVFSSAMGAWPQVSWVRADGSGGVERLVAGEETRVQFPGSCSRDRIVAYVVVLGPGEYSWDVRLLPLDGDRKTRRFLDSAYTEHAPRFSPDGRWLAYVSDESGRNEVYVQPYPGPGGKWLVSASGGTEPVWARSGRELLYRDGDNMMSVAIEDRAGFSVGKPRVLFSARYASSQGMPALVSYDVTPDGERFIMIEEPDPKDLPSRLRVVVNWPDGLKHRSLSTPAR